MSLDEVYDEISQYCPYLICTANKSMVTLFTKGFKLQIPVPQITPLSTVGAGDSFNAGLIYSLIQTNISLEDIPNVTKEAWTYLINTAVQFSSEVCMSYENFVSKGFANRLLVI
jgi:fructokinase